MKKTLAIFALAFLSLAFRAQAQVTVTWTNTHQTIDGFGAQNAATGASLPAPAEAFFFGTGSGQLGLSILRVGLTNGNYDPGNCSSVSASCAGQYVNDMKAIIANGGRVYASAYSPPASMTTNGSTICQAGGGNGALSPGSYGAFATWISNFVQSVTAQGASIYALSIQNEPEICQTYDSALWTAAQMDTFIKTNLGPTLAGAGLTPYVFMPETDVYSDLNGYGGTCMTDAACYNYVGGNNWHDYDATYPTINSTPNPWGSLNKKYWQTEGSCFAQGFCQYSPYTGTIGDALQWAALISDRLANENANAWLFLDLEDYFNTGTNIGLTENNNTTTVAQRAYALAQFAKFVRPGWVRVDATYSPASGIYVTAFKNPGSTNGAVVMVNTNGTDPGAITFNVGAFLGSSVTPYLTNASNSLATQSVVPISGGTFSFDPGASSVVTFVGNGGSGPCTTVYVDYATGNDSNTGCTTSVPWKHAPGMLGLNPSGISTGDNCTSNCASAAVTGGTKIILRGGTVWPNTVAPWDITASGASSTAQYGCVGAGCIYVGNAVGAGLPAWNNGTVTSIILTRDFGGWNPASPPSVSCSGGGGSGAAATAEVVPAGNLDTNISGSIYHIILTNTGSGYTSAPSCSLTGGSGVATLAADIDRAIFDLGSTQGSPPDWPAGQCNTHPSVCAPGLFFNGNFVIASGMETRNMLIQQPLTNNEDASFITFLGTNSTASNDYMHGMQVDCFSSSCGTYDVAYMAAYLGAPYDQLENSTYENGDYAYLGTSPQQANGICKLNNFCQPFEFGVQTSLQASAGPVDVHGNHAWSDSWQIRMASSNASGSNPYLEYNNEIWLTTYLTNYGAHVNSRYAQPASGTFNLIAYNNIVHSQVGGTSSQYQCGPGSNYTFFNETQWGIGTGTQPYSLDMADAGNLGGCGFTLYNDTMVANNSGVCVNSQPGINTTTIVMQNLQCITTPTAANPFWSTGITNSVYENYAGSTVVANVQAASVVQSITTANGQGYTALNGYKPTSSGNDTVLFAGLPGAVNLTPLCTGFYVALCSDGVGTPRANSAFQAGWINFGGSTPTAGTPTCTPGSGSYSTVQSVTCSAAGGAPVICYTVDGSTPATNGVSACTHGTLYTGAISVSSSLTLKAIAGGSGFLDGSIATYNYTFTGPASTPSCTPGSGTYGSTQSVPCSVAGGAPVLCYTTNGATPATNGGSGCTTGTHYTGAISVSSTLTLKVIAGGTGFADGPVASYSYTITTTAGTPSCTPGSGTYGLTQSVTCSVAGGAPAICFTENGSTPATNGTTGCTTGTLYAGAIGVASSLTLKAIAGGTGFADGSVVTYNYTINGVAGTPVCTPGSGTYPTTQSVPCSVAGGAPVLCYTTNGTAPGTNGTSGCSAGTLYTGAISVPATVTIRVIAGGTGFTDGSIAVYVYTIGGNPPSTPFPMFAEITQSDHTTCSACPALDSCICKASDGYWFAMASSQFFPFMTVDGVPIAAIADGRDVFWNVQKGVAKAQTTP